MSRFEKEITGQLGDFWKKSAEAEVEKVRKWYEDEEITIDENGVVINCIGNILDSEMREKLRYAGVEFNEEATAKAYEEKSKKDLEEYRQKMMNHVYSEEEMAEMRDAFGTGIVITDIITGQPIYL